MSIVVIADMFGIAGRRPELLTALTQIEREAAEQPGCLRYSVAASVSDPECIVVVAEWSDQGALEAHYASQAFESFQFALNGLLARPSETVVHTVAASTRPVASGPMDPRDAD
jgi:autoinducer 2-degrading protein